jgi:hypothetical protein
MQRRRLMSGITEGIATFGRRRKLNFIYREKRIVWVAFAEVMALAAACAS